MLFNHCRQGAVTLQLMLGAGYRGRWLWRFREGLIDKHRVNPLTADDQLLAHGNNVRGIG